MGKKLPGHSLKKHIGLLLLVFGLMSSDLQAQISITGTNVHELTFTADQTLLQSHSARISLTDMHLLAFADSDSDTEWLRYEDMKAEPARFFVPGNGGNLSIGKIPDNQDSPLFSVSYLNGSRYDFDRLNIAFDFIYKSASSPVPSSLQLYSRVNNSPWKSVKGGEILSSVLPSSADEWNSFSIQISLDKIYLRRDDRVDFRWMSEHPENNPSLPLALQRVEFSPGAATQDSIRRGSIIITELLPQTRLDDGFIEYIEIYNPKDKPVSLKGLTFRSEEGEIVIQSDAVIQPYSYFVLANEGAARREEIGSDYAYIGSVMPSSQGSLAIFSGGTELAKAMYQTTEPGTALELNEAKNSYDGYSSMEHLTPAVEELGFGVRGSPGRDGITVKFYSREISQPGWHLLSSSGTFIDELNRNPNVHFFNLDKTPYSGQSNDMPDAFLVYKEGGETVSIYMEESATEFQQAASYPITGNAMVTIFDYPGSFEPGQVVTETDERAAPVMQIWNSSAQQFKLLFSDADSLSGLNPVIMNQSASGNLKVNEAGSPPTGPRLNRYLQFRLFEETTNRRFLRDDAALLGFLRSQPGENKRYDLPKLLPFYENGDRPEIRSMIYLTASETGQPASSFSHLPYELDKTYSAGLGHYVSGSAGNFTLDWSLLNDIPDEWVLTLEDTQTGNIINMKEQTSYNFRSAGGGQITPDEENEFAFEAYQPEQRERFVITLEPFRDLFSETEQENRGGDVELRQNYPNPFNPATTIAFYLPEERPVRLGIYNVVGQQVALLLDETVSSGEHTITWNASDMPSGIYIVQLEIGNRMLTRKITLIK